MKSIRLSTPGWKLIVPDDWEPVQVDRSQLDVDGWCAALKSGKYRQSKAPLRDAWGLCCLGVLCEVQGRPKITYDDGSAAYDGTREHIAEANPAFCLLGHHGQLPSEIWIGSERQCKSLAECNDLGLSFEDTTILIKHVWTNGHAQN